MREMGAEGFLLPCWLNAGRNFVSSVPRQVSSRASQLPTGRFCRWETLPIPWEMLPIPWLNSAPAHIQPGLLASKKKPLCTPGSRATSLLSPHCSPQLCPRGAAPKPASCGCSGVPNGATQGSVLPVVPGLCLSRRECSSRDAVKAA